MEISVRTATVDDAPAIAAVNVASWEAAYRGIVNDTFLDRATLAERASGWRERIGTDGWSILVADGPLTGDLSGSGAGSPRGVVGYTALSLPSRDPDAGKITAEIAAIYVTPASFRTGIGTAILVAALELIDAHGFSEATLWVLTENARARAFYARHGFGADATVKWLDDLGAEEMRLRRPLPRADCPPDCR